MVPKICSIPECGNKHLARGWCGKHWRRWSVHGDPNAMLLTRGDNHARFWEKVNKTETCWEWTSAVIGGYGVFVLDGVTQRAHRVLYEWEAGKIPSGKVLDHICRNPICVRPGHLRPVTNKQNAENHSGAQRNSKSGVLGVSWKSSHKRWVALVGHNGKQIHVGSYKDLHEAEAAVIAKRNELYTHNDRDRFAV